LTLKASPSTAAAASSNRRSPRCTLATSSQATTSRSAIMNESIVSLRAVITEVGSSASVADPQSAAAGPARRRTRS
jgi:hypothetical protein